ncbi:MAG: hypothetical protein ACI9VR_004801 [Cognaticolwellia sp.]|jgi:hypothetical protein
MFFFLLACSESPDLSPCPETGVWDLATGTEHASIQDALTDGVEEICLGPGRYELGCEQLIGPAFSILGSGSKVTELDRPQACEKALLLDQPGTYRFSMLSLTTANMTFSAESGALELDQVIFRNLQEEDGHFTVKVPVYGHRIQVRNSVLGNHTLNFVGGGEIVGLWLHDLRVHEDRARIRLQDLSLERLRVERVGLRNPEKRDSLGFQLQDCSLQDVLVGDSEYVFFSAGGDTTLRNVEFRLEEDQAAYISVHEKVWLYDSSLGHGTVEMYGDSELFSENLLFDDPLACNIACESRCMPEWDYVYCVAGP